MGKKVGYMCPSCGFDTDVRIAIIVTLLSNGIMRCTDVLTARDAGERLPV